MWNSEIAVVMDTTGIDSGHHSGVRPRGIQVINFISKIRSRNDLMVIQIYYFVVDSLGNKTFYFHPLLLF